MRVADIELGVEYCMTAPYAYGREPDTVPIKVRFHDLRSGWGWLYRMVSDGAFDVTLSHTPAKRRTKWKQDGPAVATHRTETLAALAHPSKSSLPFTEEVGRVEYVFEPLRGAYKAERWLPGQNAWMPTLVESAAIHRTWEEYLEQQRERDQKQAERRRAAAPRQYEIGIRQVLENATLIGKSIDDVIGDIRKCGSSR